MTIPKLIKLGRITPVLFAGVGMHGATAAPSSRPNVLFIAIDDLNDWVGCLGGHPQAQTPHIDRLAARGVLFTNAHCQAPLCNPSRSSILTGLRPSSTGIYGLVPGIREVEATRNHMTLPQTFMRAGYFTYTCGKVYHDNSIKPKDRPGEFHEWGPAPAPSRPAIRISKLPNPQHPLMDWGPFPEREEETPDYKIANAAIAALRRAPREKPFFISCGFRLPHVPCFAPRQWFDLYPPATLRLPSVQSDDRAGAPRFSWYLHWNVPEPRLTLLQEFDEWRPLVRGYLASTSFMDAQLGRVLDALDATGRAAETMIVLWSDNGWHLGEKGITGKRSLWGRSTRVPLIIAGPGVATAARCGRSVELLDIFPTLLELAGMPARADLEGHSLVPQLRDATAPRHWPAITTHHRDNHSVRTEQWRYIRYADGSEELYDMVHDSNEWLNLSADPKFAGTKRELAAWLPRTNAEPVPGTAMELLVYDPTTEAVFWEGESVRKTDPVPQRWTPPR